ncbi:hypothetical protein WICMUC_000159 [Wickerhamomyces mucosus]|uniref:Ribonuclease P/MRP protein subunit POP5 n=1 Tax=Wickerhamomyces mucosus TaxID=1378264 RepID=A0A9P8TII0_9ASCO|nr:hypothetical protein WICMUC_000159 [Wickerhamomyces mucosus]
MVRLKSRYILFDIIYPPNPNKELSNYSLKNSLTTLHAVSNSNPKEILNLLRKNIELNYGDYGAGLINYSLMVKYFSNKTSTGIIRCSRENHELVTGALLMINQINDRNCIFRVIHISGTIKKCEDYAIERNKKLMKLLESKEFDEVINIDEDDDEDYD